MVDFTTNALLYPLTKGDVKGHIFHGNQYSAGVGEHVKAGEKAEKRGVYLFHNGRWKQAQDAHEEAVGHFTTLQGISRDGAGKGNG